MEKDSSKRPSAKELLRHPFLQEQRLQDTKASSNLHEDEEAEEEEEDLDEDDANTIRLEVADIAMRVTKHLFDLQVKKLEVGERIHSRRIEMFPSCKLKRLARQLHAPVALVTDIFEKTIRNANLRIAEGVDPFQTLE